MGPNYRLETYVTIMLVTMDGQTGRQTTDRLHVITTGDWESIIQIYALMHNLLSEKYGVLECLKKSLPETGPPPTGKMK